MTSPKATVTYKKKDGVLAVSDDSKHLFWTPSAPPGSAPTVTITVVDITNLQQTPAASGRRDQICGQPISRQPLVAGRQAVRSEALLEPLEREFTI